MKTFDRVQLICDYIEKRPNGKSVIYKKGLKGTIIEIKEDNDAFVDLDLNQGIEENDLLLICPLNLLSKL